MNAMYDSREMQSSALADGLKFVGISILHNLDMPTKDDLMFENTRYDCLEALRFRDRLAKYRASKEKVENEQREQKQGV